MAFLTAIGPALSAVGTVISTIGQIQAGNAAAAAANYEAAGLDIKAKEEHAAAQREADQLRRRKELALSRLTTVAAGSGFTATDPTTLNIAGETERYGTVQEQMAMYGGLSRRRGLEDQAAATRATGRAAQKGAFMRAIGTAFSGIGGTLADRYAPPASRAPSGDLYYGSNGAGSDPYWRRTDGNPYAVNYG